MSEHTQPHNAGAFDIRNVIGALLGLYGVILLFSYFVLDPGVDATTGQIKDGTYNLWAGAGLVAVAVFFFVWNKLDPVKVDETAQKDQENTAPNGV